MVCTGPAPLAGMQMKLGAYETWGCDPCWAMFLEVNRVVLATLGPP